MISQLMEFESYRVFVLEGLGCCCWVFFSYFQIECLIVDFRPENFFNVRVRYVVRMTSFFYELCSRYVKTCFENDERYENEEAGPRTLK